MAEPIHLLSLGAGVQSSTLALMAARGELDTMPAAAIFADTQAEPASVYRWLDWLEKQLPFPVHRVTAGNLESDALKMRIGKQGLKYSRTSIPFFTKSPTGKQGRITIRSCTRDFKIRPIMKEARRIVTPEVMKLWRKDHAAALATISHETKKAQAEAKAAGKKWKFARIPRAAWEECEADALVVQWIGISTDEITRMKPSRDPWIRSRWPLIEKRMTRPVCMEWMTAHGYPEPPRSACYFCPFHNRDEWLRMQTNEPEEFTRAVMFEREIQQLKGRTENFSSIPFLDRSLIPLDQINLNGQKMLQWDTTGEDLRAPDSWQDECEGMCGV